MGGANGYSRHIDEDTSASPSGSMPTSDSAAAVLSDVPLNGSASSRGPARFDVEAAPSQRQAGGTDKDSLMQGSESSYRYEPHTGFTADPVPGGDDPKGNWYHAAFHTVTAVVGAGVLGLPYAFSWLGWVAGEISLFFACVVSFYTSWQLAELHHYGGKRLNRYRDLGRAVFGPQLGLWMVVPFQFTVMVGIGITYTVAAGQSFEGIANDLCHTGVEECSTGITKWILVFGGIQLLLSQLPDFHSIWWISLLGAVMSVGYTSIAAIASLASLGNDIEYEATEPHSTADKVFGVMNALGTITFSYGGHSVLLEIQATLKEPPRAASTLMRGVGIAYVVVVVGYFTVASAGYAAFGANVNPNILLSIEHPQWLVDVANFMVIVHVVASYQVFTMPVFEALEGVLSPRIGIFSRQPWTMRILVRSLYVAFTTVMAATIPFLADLMGLVGAASLCAMTFWMPPLMWLMVRKTNIIEKLANVAIILVYGSISILATVGSIRNIITNLQNHDHWA